MAGSLARVPKGAPAAGRVVAVGLLLWLALGLPAAAHANLSRAEPEPDSKLAQPPAELRLYFTQALARKASYVLLRDSEGGDIPVQVSFDDADSKLMKAALPSLAPGMYTVKWQSLSADDDDYADGSYKLTVLNPDGSVPKAARDPKGQPSSRTRLLLVVGAGFALAVAAGTVVALRQRGGKAS